MPSGAPAGADAGTRRHDTDNDSSFDRLLE
jgi:hypothetical protein